MSVQPDKAAPRISARAMALMLAGAGAAILIAANAHLVVVALESQPDCVSHAKTADHSAHPTQYRAARPSC